MRRSHIRSDVRGVNGFYMSCNLQRFFGAKRAFFDVRQTDGARLAVYRHTIDTDV
jgi:hypothetical protein